MTDCIALKYLAMHETFRIIEKDERLGGLGVYPPLYLKVTNEEAIDMIQNGFYPPLPQRRDSPKEPPDRTRIVTIHPDGTLGDDGIFSSYRVFPAQPQTLTEAQTQALGLILRWLEDQENPSEITEALRMKNKENAMMVRRQNIMDEIRKTVEDLSNLAIGLDMTLYRAKEIGLPDDDCVQVAQRAQEISDFVRSKTSELRKKERCDAK